MAEVEKENFGSIALSKESRLFLIYANLRTRVTIIVVSPTSFNFILGYCFFQWGFWDSNAERNQSGEENKGERERMRERKREGFCREDDRGLKKN